MDGPWRQCANPSLHDPHAWTLTSAYPGGSSAETVYCPGLDGTEHDRRQE